MELRGYRRANKPLCGLFSRHYCTGKRGQCPPVSGIFLQKGRPARTARDRPPRGIIGSHDVLLRAVVRHPDAHLIQRGHREIGDAHRVEFGTQPQLRTEPKVLYGVSEFRFFQSDHPRNSMPRRWRDMGGIIRENGGTLGRKFRTRREEGKARCGITTTEAAGAPILRAGT